jgi:putative ABC transport system permease protein
MRILEGRGFQENERRGGNVIVISEPMARLGWPDQSPIGECVHVEQNNEYDNKCTTIVGVVADSRMNRISEERPHLFWYQPLAVGEELRYFLRRALLVRMAPGIGRLDNTIRRVLYELDPELPYIKIETLGEALDPEIRPWRLGASVFTAFGLFAMVLAMVGLWASVAYSVSQRTHEFAVRMAMGATWRSLVSVIIREGMKNTLVTVAAGLLIAYLVSRFIADMLFNVSPYDPVVFVSVAAGILIVSTIASLLPAFRAARIDPARSLKAD